MRLGPRLACMLVAVAAGCGLATTPDRDASDGDAGIDAAPRAGFYACASDADCLSTEYCKTSLCGWPDPPRGFCIDRRRDAASCIAGGRGCDPRTDLYCLDDGNCAFDSYGVCLTPVELGDICSHQGTLWACPR